MPANALIFEGRKMLITLGITMFAALAGLLVSLLAGMAGSINMTLSLVGASVSIAIGWACAIAIDKLEGGAK